MSSRSAVGRKRPKGFIATCKCGLVVGAMDFERTDRKEAGLILSAWLTQGCAVEPKFGGGFSVTVYPCRCGEAEK